MRAIALFLALLVSPALADETINQLGSGTTLTGSELIPMYQSANPAVTTTPSALATYVTSLGTAGFYINSTLTLSGTPSASALGLYAKETFSGGCGATQCQGNYLDVTADTATANSGVVVSAMEYGYTFGGAGMTGNRAGININASLASTSGNTNGLQSYTAIGGQFVGAANDNGTAPSIANGSGGAQGANFIASLHSGATDWYGLQAMELDVNAQSGFSVANKTGLQITHLSTDAVNGSVADAAIVLADQNGATAPWAYGIMLNHSDTGAIWPFGSSTTFLGCYNSSCGSLANFINIGSATVSGNSLQLPGSFYVTGAGALGIGGTPSYPLEVQSTQTTTTGNLFGSYDFVTYSPAGSTSANTYGFQASVEQTTNQTNTGQLVGLKGTARSDLSSATLTTAFGVQGAVTIAGAGTLSIAHAMDASIIGAAGTLGTAIGINVATPIGAASPLTTTWANTYGIEIQNQNPSGTGTNTLTNPPVGLYIASQTAAGAYAIYEAGNGLNFFSNLTLSAAAPTVTANQIGYGSTVVAASNCGGGSAVGCIVVNIAGTTHYVPYY